MVNGELAGESAGLDPLPSSLRHGLTAITVLAFISFAASTTLFSYLTYKLVAWRFLRSERPAAPAQKGPPTKSIRQAVDFALGIDGVFSDNKEVPNGEDQSAAQRPRNPPNQFLLLIYNLLLADMHQSMAFLLNVSWVAQDALVVDTPTCFTQGFFVSTGDLSSSMFITTIAVHTYLSVVRRYRLKQSVMYAIIVGIWIFVYAISVIPILATHNGASVGGFFVRAGSWCWMNYEYENLRLLTHYLFIFLALATTLGLYTTIFFSLRRQERKRYNNGSSDASEDFQLGHNPAFLIYPVIYVLCTLPLAMGRLAAMFGSEAPLPYLCFAGAMISSNGLFDCLLFGTTRNVIVFGSRHDIDASDVGLKTFTFMQTPTNRRFGNMVWVQGARRTPEDKTIGGWWSWQRLAGQSETHRRTDSTRGASEESLRGPAIQMDMVTSVVVELDKETDIGYPFPARSAKMSVASTENEDSGVQGHTLHQP